MDKTRETVTHVVDVPVTFTYYVNSALWAAVGDLSQEQSQKEERNTAHKLLKLYVDRMNEGATEMFFGVAPLEDVIKS